MRALRPTAALATLTAVAALSVAVLNLTPASAGSTGARACPPAARALGFSDRLDKVVHGGVTLGGLSDLDRDRRSHSLVSSVDNHGSDPARLWFFRDLARPHVVRDPLVLRRPRGTPYRGQDADDEGLAVLRSGRFLVSSETEPSIRIFGRSGRQ